MAGGTTYMTITAGTDDETFDSFSAALRAELNIVSTCGYPSAPVTYIDLPEVQEVRAEFFYKHYTIDEKRNRGSDSLVLEGDVVQPSESMARYKRETDEPRSIILNISVPDVGTGSGTLMADAEQLRRDLRTNADKIVFEGVIANYKYTSLTLKDDRADKTFYEEMLQSPTFENARAQSNNNSQFLSYLENLLDSPLCKISQNTSTIKKALSNAQPNGVAYSPADIRTDLHASALRDVNFVDFTMAMSTAVTSNIVRASSLDSANIYEDEITSTIIEADDVQDRFKSEIPNHILDSSEFDIEIPAIKTYLKSEYPFMDEGAFPIGFFIEKTEISADIENPGETVVTDFEPQILELYSPIKLVDPRVKYGSVYNYKIRIVYAVSYEANAFDPTGKTDPEVVYAIGLVASQGLDVKVAAVETIAPNPPKNLSFNYDFSDNILNLYWEEPYNPPRDIVRYQIFRRKSINQSFTLVAELDFDKSLDKTIPLEIAPPHKHYKVSGPRKSFKDISFRRIDKYIYALAAVDAHGLTSGYSEQIEVSFDPYKNKIVRKLISDPKAPKSYPNLYLKNDFFVDTMKSSNATRARIFFDPEYYDVFRSRETGKHSGATPDTTGLAAGSASGKNPQGPVVEEDSLRLLGDKYKLQIINLDLQNSEVFDINIDDRTGIIVAPPRGEADIKTGY